MSVWDKYGNWDEIARLKSVEDVKSMITGRKKAWRPNFCPPALAYIFDYAMEEFKAEHDATPTALDFGCGLGRNGPLLRKFFPDVIGVDLPEMVDRLNDELPIHASENYREVYRSMTTLVKEEEFCLLYDSVAFQHFVDVGYISEIIDMLSSIKSFRTFVSVHKYSEQRRPAHIGVLQEKGWDVWHTESETLSFEGVIHSLITLRRW